MPCPFAVFLIVLVFYVFWAASWTSRRFSSSPSPLCCRCCKSGVDPYVIVIILVFVGEMAGFTPPIGMNVFAVARRSGSIQG